MIMFFFHYLVLAYILFSGAASAAGENDDKTFDWLKEDVHIISSQDLRFLQKHRPSHSQPQTHNVQSPLRTSSLVVSQSEAKQSSLKKHDSRNVELREAARKEKKRKRNEKDRNTRKQLKQFDLEGYREVLDRKNALERIRMSTMPTEKIEIRLKQRNENFKRRKANRSTVPLTPQEDEKRKADRRDARNRYEESLGQKIKNKEATDHQQEVFKKEFGKILTVWFIGGSSGAGNDDNTFDWLKDDDHIVSSHDLQFLQQHANLHTHANSQNIVQYSQTLQPSTGKPEPRRGRGQQSKISDPAVREAKTKELQKKRNERYRLKQKSLALTDPEGYRAINDRIKKLANEKYANLPADKKQARLEKQKARSLIRKAEQAGVILSPEEHEKKKAKRREARKRHEKSLVEVIKSNQATDKQKQSFLKEYGIKKFSKLLPDHSIIP